MRLIIALALLVSAVFADVWVRPYTRKDGTYVPGHWRSDPNSTPSDNWTSKPNSNPYTGERGTKTCNYEWIPGYTDSDGRYHSGRYATVCN